jgi:hypothetical protein
LSLQTSTSTSALITEARGKDKRISWTGISGLRESR